MVDVLADAFQVGADVLLVGKGFFLENVEDNSGRKWKYCGIIDNLEFYRIQYFREDDYYDE